MLGLYLRQGPGDELTPTGHDATELGSHDGMHGGRGLWETVGEQWAPTRVQVAVPQANAPKSGPVSSFVVVPLSLPSVSAKAGGSDTRV